MYIDLLMLASQTLILMQILNLNSGTIRHRWFNSIIINDDNYMIVNPKDKHHNSADLNARSNLRMDILIKNDVIENSRKSITFSAIIIGRWSCGDRWSRIPTNPWRAFGTTMLRPTRGELQSTLTLTLLILIVAYNYDCNCYFFIIMLWYSSTCNRNGMCMFIIV